MTRSLTASELATVLLGLRLVQAQTEAGIDISQGEHFTEARPLDAPSIDALCEELNTSRADADTPPPAHGRIVVVTTHARADIREYWRVMLPDEIDITDDAAVRDYCEDDIYSGSAEFVRDHVIDNEEGRTIHNIDTETDSFVY